MSLRSVGVRATLSALLLSCLAAVPAMAQSGAIAGSVVNAATDRPIAGAQISIPGTSIGTFARTDGRYVLTGVPAGEHTIRAEIIGFATVEQSVTVGGDETAVVDFRLSVSAVDIDEIVVTGSGMATERRKLGHTIATIDAQTLRDAPVTTMSEILQGREPGVATLPSGGLTGEGARIRIRGNNSLAMSNEPIVYLNGVRIDNGGGLGIGTGGGGQPSRLDDIDPTTIERVEILKGAAAATLYGSEASGGVIQIFTKSGARAGGAARWDLQIEQGFTTYPDVIAPLAGFARSEEQATAVNEFWGLNVAPYEVFEVKPFDRLFETGSSSAYSLSVRGGSDVLSYYGSGRYQAEDGPIGYEEFARANDRNRKGQGTLSMTVYPRDDFELRFFSLYSDVEHSTLNNNNNIYAPFTLAMFGKPETAYCGTPDNHVTPVGNGTCEAEGNEFGTLAFGTVRETMQRSFSQEAQHYSGSLNSRYTPTEELSLQATFGVDLVNEHSSFFAPFGWNVDAFTTNNVLGERTLVDRNKRQLSLDVRGNWSTDITDDFSSRLVLGTQGYVTKMQTQNGNVRDFPGPGFEVLSAGNTIGSTGEFFESVVNAGLLAEEQLGWRDWMFLTAGIRYDWNSAFGENEPGAFYPKLALSVVPSSRPSWNSSVLSSLRLMAAIGQSGLQPGAFDRLTTYSSIRSEAGAGIIPSNLGNADLKPEVSTEWEVGLESGLFDDRVALEATYWNRTVNDALVSRQFPVTGGFLSQQLVNLGELAAHGLEMGLKGTAYSSDQVSVELFANAAYLQEKLVDLGDAPPLKVGGSYTRYRNWLKEGFAPGAFFGPELDESVPYPIDVNGDCVADSEADLLDYFSSPQEATTTAIRPLVLDCDDDFLGRYVGKPVPDWAGSFGGNIAFGSFRISTLLEYKMGNFHVHNLTDGFRRSHPALGGNLAGRSEVEAILTNPESSAAERLDAANEFVREWAALAPFDGLHEIEEADFIRWRELQLSFEVPSSVVDRWGMGADAISLTASGRNLGFLYNKYGGTDPEVNLLSRNSGGGLDDYANGIDAFGFPLARRISFAARVSF